MLMQVPVVVAAVARCKYPLLGATANNTHDSSKYSHFIELPQKAEICPHICAQYNSIYTYGRKCRNDQEQININTYINLTKSYIRKCIYIYMILCMYVEVSKYT